MPARPTERKRAGETSRRMEQNMNMIGRRTLLQLGLAGTAGLLAASPASALVKIVVTAGDFVPLPIAIPDFGSSDPTFGREVAMWCAPISSARACSPRSTL